jgi:Ca2+/Na+ antiporter
MIDFFNQIGSLNTDVIVIAVIICGLVGLLKRVIPDSKKKYLTFAPFVLGCILYGLYMLIANKGQVFSLNTLEKGVECGAASTVFYMFYEQFVKNKDSALKDIKLITVKKILKPLVKEEYLEEVSAGIISGIKDYVDDISRCILICGDIIKDKKNQKTTIIDIEAATMLIVSILKIIS